MKQIRAITTHQGEYIKIFVIFFILFAILTKPNFLGANDASRMAQIQSIVEYGSFIIDKSVFVNTIDKYFFNQHFYSDKPPILALYASPFYFVLKHLGFSFAQRFYATCYLVTFSSIGLLSVLGLVVFRRILREFLDVGSEWADVTTFVTGAGTLILPYSVVFNNHVPSGVLILLGYYFFLRYKEDHKVAQIVYSGLFFSLAGSIDINCFLFIPVMLVASARRSVKTGLIFGMACIPVVALYLFLNLYTSGSFVPPAMNASLWNYPGSAFDSETLSGLANHKGGLEVLQYAFHMLIGDRGLIMHSLILVFAIWGFFITYRRKWRSIYQSEYFYIVLASGLYILIYILRTTNYSGWAFGVRWFASLMLILCLPIGQLERKVSASRTVRSLFTGVAILSICIAIVGSYNPFTPFGDAFPDKLLPTNTIFASLHLIAGDFVNIVLTQFSLKKILNLISLFLGGLIALTIYFSLMRRYMQRSNHPNHQNQ